MIKEVLNWVRDAKIHDDMRKEKNELYDTIFTLTNSSPKSLDYGKNDVAKIYAASLWKILDSNVVKIDFPNGVCLTRDYDPKAIPNPVSTTKEEMEVHFSAYYELLGFKWEPIPVYKFKEEKTSYFE